MVRGAAALLLSYLGLGPSNADPPAEATSPLFTRALAARPEGFEPPTPRFEVWCSIQLSYERRGLSNEERA